MNCPNCQELMKEENLDNQLILHCPNCGGSFFEENGINRLSLKNAKNLSEDKKTDDISASDKFCPKDFSLLSALVNDEAIPQDVTLLRCPTCLGVFSYPEDLVNFKRAQGIKIEYLKTWHHPFSPLKTVLVLSFVLIISASLILTINTLQKTSSYQSQASDLLKKVEISINGHYLFISFQTTSPLRSQVIFVDKTKYISLEKTISQSPTTVHSGIITNLDPGDEIYYQIILYDKNAVPIKTGERKLELGK